MLKILYFSLIGKETQILSFQSNPWLLWAGIHFVNKNSAFMIHVFSNHGCLFFITGEGVSERTDDFVKTFHFIIILYLQEKYENNRVFMYPKPNFLYCCHLTLVWHIFHNLWANIDTLLLIQIHTLFRFS